MFFSSHLFFTHMIAYCIVLYCPLSEISQCWNENKQLSGYRPVLGGKIEEFANNQKDRNFLKIVPKRSAANQNWD